MNEIYQTAANLELPTGTEELETFLGTLVPRVSQALLAVGHLPSPRVIRACLVYIFKALSLNPDVRRVTQDEVAREYGCSSAAIGRYRTIYDALRTLDPYKKLPSRKRRAYLVITRQVPERVKTET